MNQKKKTIVLWGVIIVLAAAVVALSVILVTNSRKNNDPDGQKNAGTEAVIEESGQDAEQKTEDGADQKKEKGASDTQKSTDDKKTLYAEVTVGSTWENNGMTAATETVTIYNKTDKAATDWSIDLEFSGKVILRSLLHLEKTPFPMYSISSERSVPRRFTQFSNAALRMIRTFLQ